MSGRSPQKEHGTGDRDIPRRNMGSGSHTGIDIKVGIIANSVYL